LGTFFPAREKLVIDIPAEDGKLLNLYLQCESTGWGDVEMRQTANGGGRGMRRINDYGDAE